MNSAEEASRPNYLENIYPKSDLPRYQWIKSPHLIPSQVWLTETTHRDGQQGGLQLSAQTSIKIYDILCAFTSRSGLIRQAEFFVYSDSDRSALAACLERYQSGSPIEPTTWIRASIKDVELIKSFSIAETGMLASCSDYHMFHKFSPGGREAAMSAYLKAVRAALELGIRPRLHLEDATRADPEFLKQFANEVLNITQDAPSRLQVKVRLCDTMGLGLPFPEIAAPRGIPQLVKLFRTQGFHSEQLEFHPHNDTGLIVANSLSAILAGVSAINGTCLGKGERTGNAPLEQIALHLCGMNKFDTNSIDFTQLGKLAALYESIGSPISPQHPLFGKDAHRTRAGIHADGLNKNWRMYAPFDVPKILGRPLEISLTKDSGLAGIQFMIRQNTNRVLPKDHPTIIEIDRQLKRQFESGRQTAVEWEELQKLL
ncbi:MAG: pyruvate carboxyltransferase [Verrucomicrobiota bacterium]